MKTKSKNILIHANVEQIFLRMDNFSKTGMHMTESSMMMMGSKLELEQLSVNATGIGASYRWYGKMVGLTIDFTETVTKWQLNQVKEWETIGEAKMIIMSWYRMWFKIKPGENGTFVELSISYLPPKEWYFRILAFFFATMYCNWCLKNMLRDTEKSVNNDYSNQ